MESSQSYWFILVILNMGFCIACFLRDIAGGIGIHRAPVVQYIRPEIIGLVLGAFFIALKNKEFKTTGGSSLHRFVLGASVMTVLSCSSAVLKDDAENRWRRFERIVGITGLLPNLCWDTVPEQGL